MWPNFSRVRLKQIWGRTGASSHSRKRKKVSATQKVSLLFTNRHVRLISWSKPIRDRSARAQNWSPNPARTRDRLTRPDPTRAAQLNLEPEPDPKSPPPPITNKKKKEKDCISRLHAKKRINQGSAISQTFTSYESLWTSGAAVAYILPSLWILYGQEDDDRANYGNFLSVKAR